MATQNTITIWFDTPMQTVRVMLMQREKVRFKGWKRANPYEVIQVLDAIPPDKTQPISSTNKGKVSFSLAGIKAAYKVVFHSWGLDANGNIMATLSAPAKA